MTLYRSLEEAAAGFAPSALTIGNFDGVHIGHRRILRRVRETAAGRSLRASVLTFDPHPTAVVAPERAPLLMTTPEERAALMEAEGVAQAVILPFTTEVARLTPEEFASGVLADKLGVKAVLVGGNFRFGRGHSGDVNTLRELGARYGFTTEIVPEVECRGRIVSSSGIRRLLSEGKVSAAARFLGRPHTLSGEVVPGRGVGSKQTVPTLNLATRCQVIPQRGVYVTRTRDLDGGGAWRSVTNIGYRPTFGESEELTIETFLLEPLRVETPRRIAVEFLHRLRGERRFDSPEQLKAQILRDVSRAQAWFRRVERWVRR